MVLKAK